MPAENSGEFLRRLAELPRADGDPRLQRWRIGDKGQDLVEQMPCSALTVGDAAPRTRSSLRTADLPVPDRPVT
jgi:hypothetical protein